MQALRGVFTTAAATVAAGALALALSGCGPLVVLANETLPHPTAIPKSDTTSAPGPSSAPTPIQRYSDGSTSERGNIPKVVGQKAGILSDDGQTRLVTFIVTRIVPNPSCQNSSRADPEHGHYLEVDLQVITTTQMGTDGGAQTITFAPDTWYYYPGGSNGGVGAVGTTDNCVLAIPALPATIGPGETVSGSVLLDVNGDSRYLAYAPDNGGCGCSSWEWPYSPAG